VSASALDPMRQSSKGYFTMSNGRLSSAPDLARWRCTLLRKARPPFAGESPAPLSAWPGASEAHAGVALLLSLLGVGRGRRMGRQRA
jgi:hypothetical protein